MAEWFKAAALKTVGGVNNVLRGFKSYSTRQKLKELNEDGVDV